MKTYHLSALVCHNLQKEKQIALSCLRIDKIDIIIITYNKKDHLVPKFHVTSSSFSTFSTLRLQLEVDSPGYEVF